MDEDTIDGFTELEGHEICFHLSFHIYILLYDTIFYNQTISKANQTFIFLKRWLLWVGFYLDYFVILFCNKFINH